jgi:hypothetical protein
MKAINRWVCWLRHAWWSINGGIGDGHVYLDEEVHHNKTVVIGHCEVCGKLVVSWGERIMFEHINIKQD